MHQPDPPHLSVVVPAYNEARNLDASLGELADLARRLGARSEVLVVDDGSSDATRQVVEAHVEGWPEESRLRLLWHTRNRGKGAAVRTGMLAALGEHVVFTDADLAYGTAQIGALLAVLEHGVDVAIGRREHHRGLLRRVTGFAYRILVRCTRLVDVADPQCGLKGFRGPVAAVVFGLATIDDFAFDVEALVIADVQGFDIAEVPVRMRDPATNGRRGTSVNLVTDTAAMLRSLRRIRLNRRSGLYVVPAPAPRARKWVGR